MHRGKGFALFGMGLVLLLACRALSRPLSTSPAATAPLTPPSRLSATSTAPPFTGGPSPTASRGISALPVTPAAQVDLAALPHIEHWPENGNGRCILFVHGLGGSKERWQQDMAAFSQLGFCTLAWDLPFHGERPRPSRPRARLRGYVILQGAEELIAWSRALRERGAREVYVVARSLGTFVAGVALGKGAEVDKAEFLLAGANLPYILEHGQVRDALGTAPEERLRLIDPMYYLPNYTGAIHFHCGKRDALLTPEACQFAYDAASHARERRLFWHDTGHRMPLDLYFEEAKAFFLDEGASIAPSSALLAQVNLPAGCGNNRCDVGEDWQTCPWDCAVPPLLIGFQLHIEETVRGVAYDADPAFFAAYADTLEHLARLFEGYGAVLSIQTEKTFARADVAFGRGVLRDLVARGHGVGVQSHLGHHLRQTPMPTDQERLAYTREVKETVARAIGKEPTNLGGGFELHNVALLGVCPQCLGFISMTALEKPYFQATHRPPQRLQPWILPAVSLETLDHADWMAHDPSGTLVYLPGWYQSTEFEIDCRRNPDCFRAATISLQAALHDAEPGRINVWWCSSHLYQTGTGRERDEALRAYEAWLRDVVAPLAEQGQVVWMNFDQMAQVYLRWEKARQMYAADMAIEAEPVSATR